MLPAAFGANRRNKIEQATTLSNLIGHTLGQYKIIDQLGAGGMGVVYRAQDVRLGRLVALKVLPHGSADDEEAVERFRREARTASSLNHPNICTIYSFDEHAGQLYLAMELLEGEPLDRKLGGRSLGLRAILEIGSQIADALDAAHSEGILHRDIKPANIFLTRRGQVKVLDFGLAKLAPGFLKREEAASHATAQFTSMAGTTVGTIAYMSPEQARGEDVDPRTDLFSFGVVLYEMATGRQSFAGATTAVVFDGILNRDPTTPSALNAAIPSELDRIISKALEKERGLRYQSAADMRADLQRLRRDSGTRRMVAQAPVADPFATVIPRDAGGADPLSAETVFLPSPTPKSGPPMAPPAATAPLPPRRQAWSPMMLAAAAMVGLVVLIGVAFVVAWRLDGLRAPVADSVGSGAGAPPPSSASPPSSPPLLDATPSSTTPSPNAPAVSPTSPKVAPVAGNATAAKAATTPKSPSTKAPVDNTDVMANERLDAARAKIAGNQLEPALADLRQIMIDFPGSSAAVGASFLSAEILDKLGRVDEALTAHEEFARRFGGDSRAAASKLRAAQLIARSKRPNRDVATRALLTEVIETYPRTPQAFQALQAKLRMDGELRQRVMDPILGAQVPAMLPTLRALTEQFPNHPSAMIAFNRLAGLYVDLEQYERAAQTLSDLGAHFPENPYDSWYRVGELYERRLKDRARARDAYAKVPPRSSRYRDAQRKLKER